MQVGSTPSDPTFPQFTNTYANGTAFSSYGYIFGDSGVVTPAGSNSQSAGTYANETVNGAAASFAPASSVNVGLLPLL
jgi:hypothetical protein